MSETAEKKNALHVQLVGAATKRALDRWYEDGACSNESYRTFNWGTVVLLVWEFDEGELGIVISRAVDANDEPVLCEGEANIKIETADIVLNRKELAKMLGSYLVNTVCNKMPDSDDDEDEDEDSQPHCNGCSEFEGVGEYVPASTTLQDAAKAFVSGFKAGVNS